MRDVSRFRVYNLVVMLTGKRALVFALLAYFSTFIAAIVSSVALGYDPTQLVGTPPLDYCVAIIISSTIASVVFSYLYFTYKAPAVKPSAILGFKFGITLLVLGFILDMLFFLPVVMISGNLQQVFDSYSQVYIFLVFAGVVAGSTLVGYLLERNSKSSQ